MVKGKTYFQTYFLPYFETFPETFFELLFGLLFFVFGDFGSCRVLWLTQAVTTTDANTLCPTPAQTIMKKKVRTIDQQTMTRYRTKAHTDLAYQLLSSPLVSEPPGHPGKFLYIPSGPSTVLKHLSLATRPGNSSPSSEGPQDKILLCVHAVPSSSRDHGFLQCSIWTKLVRHSVLRNNAIRLVADVW